MYHSLEALLEASQREGKELYQIILEEDCREQGISQEQGFANVRNTYEAMKAADREYDPNAISHSRLVGRDGERLRQYRAGGNSIGGDFSCMVIEKAVKMGESNACMRRIVAAPTAGSCGVLPAVLLSMEQVGHYEPDRMVQALIVAAGVGGVIANRAFLAGAAGGCQAEIGSAASMAAAAAVFLKGGTASQSFHAAAMALKNLLGLSCDPVGGLVEVPCVKRNVIGAMSAISAADMALAGLESRIPPDQVIDAMRSIGMEMPSTLRETGKGGLADTPEGRKYRIDGNPSWEEYE